MKNWSLRLKITLLVGLITALACALLTANSILSAERYYGPVFTQELYSPDDAVIREDEPGLPLGDSEYQLATQKFSMQGMGATALIVLLALGLTYFVTGRVLAPLTALNRSIRDMGQENLHQRVDLPNASGEVRQLTQSFNGMLGRLEESFALQRQFSSNAAHELKTPLAVMKAALQVLELEPRPSETDYREFVEDTGMSVERLIRTVDNLLALTRDASGERPEEVELGQLLGQVEAELAPRAAERGVTLRVAPAEGTVFTNRTLLYRAVYNLVENALKYNRPGGSVSVGASQAAGRAALTVSDTGIGMDAETLRRACEPFYRADASRSQDIPGSGLGLAIVKLVAEQLGGELDIVSELGRGTRVTFSLPPFTGNSQAPQQI